MVIHNIRLPKQSTVGDVINELKTKVVQYTWNLVCSIIACICVSHIKGFLLRILFRMIACLKHQVELSHPDAELRLLEVFYHKIYKVTGFFFFFWNSGNRLYSCLLSS